MNEAIWKSLIRRSAYARNHIWKDRKITIIKIEGDKIKFSFQGMKHGIFTTSKQYLLEFEDYYFN